MKNEIIAEKMRKEFELSRLMKKELEENSMKKLTQQKYDMLLQKEREILKLQSQKKIRK
jgi:hypothetical protein